MKDFRIVFMGTPEFAVTILDKLLEKKINIVGVITAVDKPSGRGQKLNQSAVKKYALSKNLTLLQPQNLKDKNFLKSLKALKANLQIVVAFRMLPKIVWNLPKYGTFNLHASLLPKYRGAAPINWAIINGEKKTGVTTFFIDDKIDTGEIILQESTNIKNNETAGELHDRLMFMGAKLVVKTIDLISKDNFKITKQSKTKNKLAPKLFSDNCKIDWSKSLNDIYNHIRGLNPHPSAWTTILNGDKKINAKIYDVSKVYETHNYTTGKIITSKNELKIYTKEGYFTINKIKLSGKKLISSKSLLNGFVFDDKAKAI